VASKADTRRGGCGGEDPACIARISTGPPMRVMARASTVKLNSTRIFSRRRCHVLGTRPQPGSMARSEWIGFRAIALRLIEMPSFRSPVESLDSEAPSFSVARCSARYKIVFRELGCDGDVHVLALPILNPLLSVHGLSIYDFRRASRPAIRIS